MQKRKIREEKVETPKTTGYSLWLVPERKKVNWGTFKFLSWLILEIAAEYDAPIFEPHVTLLGGIEGDENDVCEKTRMLAEKLAPYSIKLGKIDSNETYFQILFSAVEQTPKAMEANAIAQKVFGVNKGEYFPHFSLAYGNLSKKQIVKIKKYIEQRYHLSEATDFFLVNKVELWRCEGTVEEWRHVATFPFGKT